MAPPQTEWVSMYRPSSCPLMTIRWLVSGANKALLFLACCSAPRVACCFLLLFFFFNHIFLCNMRPPLPVNLGQKEFRKGKGCFCFVGLVVMHHNLVERGKEEMRIDLMCTTVCRVISLISLLYSLLIWRIEFYFFLGVNNLRSSLRQYRPSPFSLFLSPLFFVA
jgi:hypothetical protein